ncbi:MAG: hypothetical protein LUH04_08245, partial [Clostridium sp.]|nr:hypothetical protein [Clostridium sp.]
MAVIVILVGIVFVGYFIYQSSPATQLQKAISLCQAKDYMQASRILEGIIDKHPKALSKLAECKLMWAQESTQKNEKWRLLQEVTALRRNATPSSINTFETIEAKALFELASMLFAEAGNNVGKLNQNIGFIKDANQKGMEADFQALKTKHFIALIEIYFHTGIQQEKNNRFSEAIQAYSPAKEFAWKAGNRTIASDAIARIGICQLKQNAPVNVESFSEINQSSSRYQPDFYYRYAVKLLREEQYSEAEKIINAHLNYRTAAVDKLKHILYAKKQNDILLKITAINQFIDRLYEHTASVEEIKRVYDSLNLLIRESSGINAKLTQKIAGIKSTLFSRLLSHYMSAEQYGNAINLIRQLPEYWKKPELLKNLGICCYGFTSKGLLNEKNYQIIISGWLTAVYSDRVILNSLEESSWDDRYVFTLAEAIGSNHCLHRDLPDNVNYDPVSEDTVSIGATQKELLQYFESLIHITIQEDAFSRLVNDFYDREKDAIERIITFVENDLFFSTPYFAKSYALDEPVIEALESVYLRYANEEVLEAGILYLQGTKNSKVREYARAREILQKLTTAIKEENTATVKSLNVASNKKLLSTFQAISRSIEDNVFEVLTERIEIDRENENLIPLMEECIRFSMENARLKYQYSNYVANYCIDQVNAKKMTNLKALSLMKEAYLHSPDNTRICKNFITLIDFNLMDILNDRVKQLNKIYVLLDWVKNNMSQTYKQNSEELSRKRRELLQDLRQMGVDISLVEGNRYGVSLNEQGLTLKKVLTYFKELGNEQPATDIFSRLRQQLNTG